MNGKLKRLINIFNPDGIDWMGVEKTNSNDYTYHHILKKEHGGKASQDNGAILTKKAHVYLHYLEVYDYNSYEKLNYMFSVLNNTGLPPTDEYFEIIEEILNDAIPYKENNKPITRTRNRSKK